MSKSSQRRISRRKPKTKVSLGTIAEFQRRLDSIQINLANVWQAGWEDGHAWGSAESEGRAIGEPVNPYLAAIESKVNVTVDGKTTPLDDFEGQIVEASLSSEDGLTRPK